MNKKTALIVNWFVKLQHFLPVNKIIRKHVECYHFLNFEEKHLKQEVIIYPHYLNTVSFQDNFSSDFSNSQFTYQEYEDRKINFNVLGRFTKPLTAKVDGRIKALSVVFKPTGINFFCDKTFDEIVPQIHAKFPFWNDRADELTGLLYCSDVGEITTKLENILLSFYRPFQNEILSETLRLLHGNYADYNVEELARTLKVNRKTLLRLFAKHIGVSITDYRRILRFREAIKLHAGADRNLTRLAYESCFCDQSHFIKDFHKLAGENPKKVFKEAGFVKDTPFFLKITAE